MARQPRSQADSGRRLRTLRNRIPSVGVSSNVRPILVTCRCSPRTSPLSSREPVTIIWSNPGPRPSRSCMPSEEQLNVFGLPAPRSDAPDEHLPRPYPTRSWGASLDTASAEGSDGFREYLAVVGRHKLVVL